MKKTNGFWNFFLGQEFNELINDRASINWRAERNDDGDMVFVLTIGELENPMAIEKDFLYPNFNDLQDDISKFRAERKRRIGL